MTQRRASRAFPAREEASQPSQEMDSVEPESSQFGTQAAKRYVDAMSEQDLRKAVKDTVRLALFAEMKRQPLKREDVVKKVLKTHSRAFFAVLELANKELRSVFGMELVELPAKDSQSKTSNGSSSLKKYVLTSLLPNKVREGLLDLGTDGPYLTLITLTLTLIHINEHSLSNAALIVLLEQIGVSDETMEDTLGSACSTVDVFLKNALKAGYLDKNSAVNKDEAPYVWGPRAKIDFPEENVSEFIISLYSDVSDRDKQELTKDLKKIRDSIR